MKVLVAEDDENIRNGLCEILEDEGCVTLAARDGDEALALARREAPDLICLDIMMPGKSGFQVCRELRERGDFTPIIFITAKSEEVDMVLGLELGGDDFIVKPFGVREVVARIRAVMRRCMGARMHAAAPESFQMLDMTIHPAELRAVREGAATDLSLRDIKLLRLFHQHPGQVLDRHKIFAAVWGVDHIPNSRTLDQHIAQLRKRIEIDPKAPRIIKTVHGAGYRFDGQPAP